MGNCAGNRQMIQDRIGFCGGSRNKQFTKQGQDIPDIKLKTENDKDFNEIVQANEKKKISKLVYQLTNDKKLIQKIQIQHAWAQPPQSLGSLSTMYLGLMFMRNDDYANTSEEEEIIIEQKDKIDDTNIRKMSKQVIKYDIAFALKQNLKSPFADRVELTILCIMFLTQENNLLQNYFIDQGIFDILIQFIKSKDPSNITYKIGMRVAALKSLRELYMSKIDVSFKFCSGDGIDYLMDFLTSKNDDCVIEGLCALDDLCKFTLQHIERYTLYPLINQDHDEKQDNDERNKKILSILNEKGFVKVLQQLYYESIEYKKNPSIVMNPEEQETKREIEEYSLLLKQEICKAIENQKMNQIHSIHEQ